MIVHSGTHCSNVTPYLQSKVAAVAEKTHTQNFQDSV